jgi:hypothetical protein
MKMSDEQMYPPPFPESDSEEAEPKDEPAPDPEDVPPESEQEELDAMGGDGPYDQGSAEDAV